MSAKRRLVTISISHYCEKARWALDRASLEYVEEGHYPNAHYIASFMLARQPTMPILVDNGQVIADSTAIIRHLDNVLSADTRLFPDDPTAMEVEKLEVQFDTDLGPAARCWGYWHWFGVIGKLVKYGGIHTPRFERIMAPYVIHLMKHMTRIRFKVTDDGAAQSLATVRSVFDEVGRRLSDGRRYLTGGCFTAADLGFASLAAPVLLPAKHGVPLPTLDEAPPAMREEIEKLRETPAGKFVLRLYAQDRHSRA
ncbi:MAG: glutathione S-transferase family protein [Nevskiales bacterium]